MKRGFNIFGVLAVGLFTVLTLLALLAPLTQVSNNVSLLTSDNFFNAQVLLFPALAVIGLIFAFILAIKGGTNA